MATYEEGLAELGFVLSGGSRRGGRMWRLQFNRHLEFVLHDYEDEVVLSWSFQMGEYAAERGWILGSGERSFHQLFPTTDVKLDVSIDALEAELRRTLSRLQLNLADPSL